jgi:acetyl-CoA C-acetyltransferase
MERSVIVSALRTPIGRFMGGLSTLPAPRLAAGLIKETVSRTKLDTETVDEVILGNVLQAGVGQAPARQAMIFGGVAPSVAAVTINKVCGSGLKSVMLAAQAIKAGDAEIVSPARRARRSALGSRPFDRRHDQRRPVGLLQRLSHG